MTTQPTQHGGTWTAAHKAKPHLGARNDHYDPPCWSIQLTEWDAPHSIYVTGTPADLHAFALRVLAVADQAVSAEAEHQAANPCPAGGPHVYEEKEEAGTGRTGWGCQECGAPRPTEDDEPESSRPLTVPEALAMFAAKGEAEAEAARWEWTAAHDRWTTGDEAGMDLI